jgi:putative transposase
MDKAGATDKTDATDKAGLVPTGTERMPLDYPRRKITRLASYDYSWPGAYFVMVCTHGKAHLLGTVDGEEMRLNELGEIIARTWNDIPNHFASVKLDEFIVMPNHMHGILFIEGTDKAGLFPKNPARFGHPGAGSLSTIIGSFKSRASREIRQMRPNIASVWQSRFIEHIIRDDEDLYNHRRYIRDNPARWHLDSENV